MQTNKTILAIASLSGTIIGAGVFGLPYVVSRSGVFISLFYFALLGMAVLLLHLLYSEVILSTQGRHQIAGYTKKYLGENAKKVIVVSTIIGTIGALLAYIILAGKFLQIILPWGFSTQVYAVLFWFVASFLVFLGIKSIAQAELIMLGAMTLAFLIVAIFCLPHISLLNFRASALENIFLPFGVVMFSLVGWNAIPEIMDVLGNNKKKLKKVIIASFLFCLALYIIFSFSVVAVSGSLTTQEPFEGLLPFLGSKVIFLGGLLGFLAVATSFLILANYLKHTLQYDCKLPRILSPTLAVALPFSFYLLGATNFISVISLVGVFIGLAEGASIVLIFRKARFYGDRVPEYRLNVPSIFLWLLIAILLAGVIAEIIIKL